MYMYIRIYIYTYHTSTMRYRQLQRQLDITRSRSVDLYNPSIYSGMFVKKATQPLAYTRMNTSFPSHNQLSVTQKYVTKGTKSELMTKNIVVPWWNIPTIYPLQCRRSVLV